MSPYKSLILKNPTSSTIYYDNSKDFYTTVSDRIYDEDKYNTESEADCDGYVSSIWLNGNRYKIKAEVVEVFPTICKRCGGSFELHHGEGSCPCCGTHYTTMYKGVEDD